MQKNLRVFRVCVGRLSLGCTVAVEEQCPLGIIQLGKSYAFSSMKTTKLRYNIIIIFW